MRDHLSEAILHALVAAVCLEALILRWRVADPGQRLRLRGLVVVLPTVYLPLLEWLAPRRHTQRFEEELALFVGRRWGDLTFLGVGLDVWWFLGFAGFGLLFFLRDFLPAMRDRHREHVLEEAPHHEATELHAQVRALAAKMEVEVPRVVLVESDAALLLCRGAAHPTLVISRGTMSRLDPEELRAAIAHELGHLARFDVAVGWFLMGARAIQAFNPVIHWAARAMARDAERRADDHAAAAVGDRVVVASALLKMYQAAHGAAAGEPLWWPVVSTGREAALEERCRRLLAGAPPRDPAAGMRFASAMVGLMTLLFFVV